MNAENTDPLSDEDYQKKAMESYQNGWISRADVTRQEILERRRNAASLVDKVVDVPIGAVEGIINAPLAAGDLVNRTLGGSGIPLIDEEKSATHNTFASSMAKGVAQFVTSYELPGSYARSLGKAYEVGRLGRAALSLGAGAVADFTGFDGNGGRLSDLVELYPMLSNPLTRYLKSDPGDTWAQKRFKGALEGMGLGAVGELLLGTLHGARTGEPVAEETVTKANAFLEEMEKADAEAAAKANPTTAPFQAPEAFGSLNGSTQISNDIKVGQSGVPNPTVPELTDLRPKADNFSTPPATPTEFKGTVKTDLYKSPSEITGEPVPNRDFTQDGSGNHGLCY
jgi:hypothetical protein